MTRVKATPLQDLTDAEWRNMTQAHRAPLPAEVAEPFLLGFHGGRREALEAFREVPALPPGAFARCMGVPATTLRYYTRLGLVPYIRYRGRNLYPAFACMGLARVLSLRRLGLGMQEIARRLDEEQALSRAHLEAMQAAGVDPLAGEVAPEIMQAALDSPLARAALTRLGDDRRSFMADLDSRLNVEKAEIEQRLDELRRLGGGR